MWLREVHLLRLRVMHVLGGGARPVTAVAAVARPLRALSSLSTLLVLLRHVLQRLRRRGHLAVRPRRRLALRRLEPSVRLAAVEVEVLNELRILGYFREEILEGRPLVAVLLSDEIGEFRERGGRIAIESGRALVETDELVVGYFRFALGFTLAFAIQRRRCARRRRGRRRRRAGRLDGVRERLHGYVRRYLLRLRVRCGGGEL